MSACLCASVGVSEPSHAMSVADLIRLARDCEVPVGYASIVNSENGSEFAPQLFNQTKCPAYTTGRRGCGVTADG
jgi:hypothetical protein